MKHFLSALLVCSAAVLAADKPAAEAAKIQQCFKVRRLLKTDATHYWADWSNTCPFTIEAVYVLVGFLDRSKKELGNGVWPMYFVPPGTHRVTRFSAPVSGFESVRVHRITTDFADALSQDRAAIESVLRETIPPGTVGDTAMERVIPYDPPRQVVRKSGLPDYKPVSVSP
jgi:hypothetical protein